MATPTLADAAVLSSRVKDLLYVADMLVCDPMANLPGTLLAVIEVTLAEARKLDDLLDELAEPVTPRVSKENGPDGEPT